MKKAIKNLLLPFVLAGLITSCHANQQPTDDPGDKPDDPPPVVENIDTEGDYELPTDRPVKVLFLGNSLIFFNDMPQIFDSLATVAGKDVVVDSVTQGSCTMSLLASETIDIGRQARNKLTAENWDFVIIEPSRRASPFENTVLEAEIEASKVLDNLAQEAGAKTLIYSVWGNDDGKTGVYSQVGENSVQTGYHDITRKAHTNFMWEFSRSVSKENHGSKIVRSGFAFENIINDNPEINLYHTDYHHPSPEGSYLVACNFYNAIFEESCVGINYTFGLSSEVATTLQEQSDKAMIDKVVPELDEIPGGETTPIDYTQKTMFMGASLQFRDDYHPADQYKSLMAGLGETVSYEMVLDGSYTNRAVAWTNGTKSLIFRATLANYDFDVIIIQISRRITKHSPEVAQAEKEALLEMIDVLHEETNNILIYAPKGDNSQKMFKVDDSETYAADGVDFATGIEESKFYASLADEWANEINGKSVPYSEAYLKYKYDGEFTATSAGLEYLHACCFYSSLYQEAVPEDCTWNNDLDANEASYLRQIAYETCVLHDYYEEEVPESGTNVLLLGAGNIMKSDYNQDVGYATMMGELGETVTYKTLFSDSFTYKKIAEGGSLHNSLMNLLNENEFDIIIIQISRRTTKSSNTEESELAAIHSLKETLQAETNKIYIFAPKGEKGQYIFEDDGTETYSKTSSKETDTQVQCAYYSALAETIAADIGATAIKYSNAYKEYKFDSGLTADSKGVTYLITCCLYSAIHQAKVPDTIVWKNDVADEDAAILRTIAAKHNVIGQ